MVDVEGGETAIRIYYVRRKPTFNNRKINFKICIQKGIPTPYMCIKINITDYLLTMQSLKMGFPMNMHPISSIHKEIQLSVLL